MFVKCIGKLFLHIIFVGMKKDQVDGAQALHATRLFEYGQKCGFWCKAESVYELCLYMT